MQTAFTDRRDDLFLPATQYVDVEGQHVALTNLDKVLYPGAAFTKAHVIDHYMRVGRRLLPHYARRPVTLQRFPDGVHGKAFYEKDAPKYTPAWVHTTEVPRRAGGKPIRYICIDDLPTLVWCANIASLELHPFLHLGDYLDRPTAMVFDLDPGEGANLVTCAEVAFLLRSLLTDKGLQSFPKVSGSKGLQLYVPLNAPVTYAQTRSFAHEVARTLERQHPDLIVSEMAKGLRGRKVFIDWSQNSDFKTTIGIYSLRAKSDVPYVSAPVSWAELESLRKNDDPNSLRFTPDTLLKRVGEIGDLSAPLLTLKQSLTPTADAGRSRPKPSHLAVPATVTVTAAAPPTKPVSKLPRFVEPMLLQPTNQLPEGKEWLYEVKLDGYRALASKGGGQVVLRSKNNKNLSAQFPSIVRALEGLPDETTTDGEVVALDEEGRPSFNLLQNYGSARAPIVYYVFDVLMLRGKDITAEPLSRRREVLADNVISDLSEPIRISPQLEASLPDLIRSVKAQGLEGLIAKRRDSVYESGKRSGRWQKMRINQGQDLVIGGYTPGARTSTR